MSFEKRDMSGALFKAKANENPKWPGYEGSATIDGKDYYVSAWVKDGKSGKFFSLAFKPKDKTETYVGGIRKDPPPRDDDGAIPF